MKAFRKYKAWLVTSSLAALILSPGANAQPAKPKSDAQAILLRTISLAELGFGNGLRFGAMGGEQEVFFPAPAGVRYRAARLVLSTKSVELWPNAQHHFELLVNGRSILARTTAQTSGPETVAIPLMPDDIRAGGDYVRITMRYSGVIAPERCLNLSRALDHITVLPETGLELEIERDSLDSPGEIMALLPRHARIELPPRELEPATVAAALMLARHLRQVGRSVTFALAGRADEQADAPHTGPLHWREGVFSVAPSVELAALGDAPAGVARFDMSGLTGALRVAHRKGGPAILVGGSNPQLAAAVLAGKWQAAVPGDVTVGALKPVKAARSALSFAAMGLKPAARATIEETEWVFSIPARIAPPGRRIAALELSLTAAPDDAGRAPIASVFINGQLAVSAPVGPSQPVRLVAKPPHAALMVENSVRVVVQRLPTGGECRTEPVIYPADLLPESRVLFARAGAARTFADFPATLRGAVAVALPSSHAETVAAALPLLGETLARLVSADMPIVVRFGQPLAMEGFIHFADAPPIGFEAPVTFDAKLLRLAYETSGGVAELAGDRDVASVQLLTRAGHAAGLWVKPASRPLDATRLDFSLGDVSLLHEEGSLSFATRQGGGDSGLAHMSGLQRIWQEWTSVIVLMAWLGASILFISGLRRLGRRNTGDDA
jgi:hypothetical protein